MPLIRRPPSETPPAPSDEERRAEASHHLGHADPDRRWAAVRDLANNPRAVEALSGALASESSSIVREAIFTSLMRIGTAESGRVLADYLRSDDAAFRTGAMDALAAMPEAAGNLVPALLEDDDPDVRVLACDLVRGLAPGVATPLLCALLDRETEKNVCGAAIDVLAEVGTPAAADALARCAVRFAEDPYLVFAVREAVKMVTSLRPADG